MIKAIISDADGTLVNTLYLIRHGQYEAVVTYLLSRGVSRDEIPDYEDYEKYLNQSVGGSTRETLEKTLNLIFKNTHEHLLSKIDLNELDASLEPIQDHIATLYVHPFHGLTELFAWTGKSNIKMGIFTSGNRRMIIRNFGVSLPVMGYTDLFRLDDISVDERFNAFISRAKAVYGIPELVVITCEDVVNTKPHPEGILSLIKKLDVKPDEVLVFGDHRVDIQAAIAAGVHAIGVSHGFGNPAELKEVGALRVINDLAMLPSLIEKHNSQVDPLF